MPLKPPYQLFIIGIAAIAAYGIVSVMQPKPVPDMKTEIAVPASLPAVYFFDKNGNKTDLSAFQGKMVLVNVWASWCPPCVVELPALQTLQAKLRDKDFQVLALSVDRTPMKAVTAFLKGRGIDGLDVYLDQDRQITSKWKYDGIPVSFLIAPDGRVLKKYEGPQEWDKSPVFDEISGFIDD